MLVALMKRRTFCIFPRFICDEANTDEIFAFNQRCSQILKSKTFQDMNVVCLTSASFTFHRCLVSDNQYCVLNKLLT